MTPELHSKVSIPRELHEYIPAAILRLQYIYPELTVESTATGLILYAASKAVPENIEREVSYQVYRESIFQKTLPMRRNLYQMLAE